MNAGGGTSPVRLTDAEIAGVAGRLWEAEQRRTPIEPLTANPQFHRDDASPIQLAVTALRREQGQRVVGKKIGLTSKAMQDMAGVAEPDYGHLFDVMWLPDGSAFKRADLIQPKVEPELAFVLGSRLRSGARPADVLAATSFITPALEIVDSRIIDWRVRWGDTVADNGSSARFVLSEQGFSPLAKDIRSCVVRFTRSGELLAEAPLSEVLGSPLRSVCWLAQKLDEFGIALEPGDVVLAGSPCRAVDADVGDDFTAEIDGMATVCVGVE